MTTAAPYQESFLQVRDTRIQLLRAGSGPPLVFLHGAAGAGLWSPALVELAQSFTVYLPSHPGFGTSDWPDWLDGIDDLVFHYRDLIEVLGLEKPNVAGASLGGWIAAELAVVYPERIGKLVLGNAAGLAIEGVEVPDIFLLTPEQTTRLLYHDPAKADQAVARLANLTPEQTARMTRDRAATARLAWQPYFYNPKLARRLERIRVPTLIVWGAQDRLFPLALGEAYARAIPGARLAVIDQCGHSPHNEQPAEFARILVEFLGMSG